eukprot:3932108-Rhodomonas_salina.1
MLDFRHSAGPTKSKGNTELCGVGQSRRNKEHVCVELPDNSIPSAVGLGDGKTRILVRESNVLKAFCVWTWLRSGTL